jgi:cysteine-rich repeat protein
MKQANEACDDGNTLSGDGCRLDCKVIEQGFICPVPGQPCGTCGDGILDSDEDCDDGNNADMDGCSANCQTV